MSKTAEDNFRIEVWDREEKNLVETICRSPDSTVSQAAWQAAIRRRPGMVLIHYNSRHVMEKIVTPGEPTIPPQTIVDGSVHAGLDVALGDLREWHTLRAWCKNCSHHAEVKAAELPAATSLSTTNSSFGLSSTPLSPWRLFVSPLLTPSMNSALSVVPPPSREHSSSNTVTG
ncbi:MULTISPECIES: hypothetical protein [unclassified Mesorhizobium]|uniref:hypothetical protein n=1 Tax=unclassified Mesorhizobium TaxID=325217 RepID=UPI001FE052C2|nr:MULTISPECIES: hypothetical protein [unclassified Mesorhizobium]